MSTSNRTATLLTLLSIPLLAGSLVGSLTGCQRDANSEQQTGVYTGYVEAELLYIAAPASGWLTASSVQEGDSVVVDDLLFELEAELQDAQLEEANDRLSQSQAQARDLATGARAEEIEALQSQLAEAQTNLDLAELERQRLSALADQGIVAQDRADRAIAEHEAARARFHTLAANIEVAQLAGRKAAREAAQATAGAAEASVRQARWRLDERRVAARASGRVEEIFQHPGEFVAVGSPVLSLLPEASLEVRFFVPQSDLSLLSPGSSVEVLSDMPTSGTSTDGPVTARVTYIARQAEFTPPVIYSVESREKLVFLVRAKLDQGADSATLRPGQPVDVRLR